MQKLLYSYAEAAEVLGCGVETIRRRVRAGTLDTVGYKVTLGSMLRIAGIDARGAPEHLRPAPGVSNRKEKRSCHTEGRTRSTGGHRTSIQAASELDALLRRKT